MRTDRALLLLALLLLAAGCGGAAEHVDDEIRLVGVSAYRPVPSDALAIRRADVDATVRLREVARGYRYARREGAFEVVPGAFPDVQVTDHQVVLRDALRLDNRRVFVSTIAVPATPLYDVDQLAAIAGGRRFDLTITIGPGGWTATRADGTALPIATPRSAIAPGPVTVDRLRRALDHGIQQALRLAHREGALQVSGRVFPLRCTPRMMPDDAPDMPADPADSPSRETEYRYRTGLAMHSPLGEAVAFDVSVVVVPDRRF